LRDLLGDEQAARYWAYLFESSQKRPWDCAWTYASFRHRGVHVVPAGNLVSNLGFGPLATNTTTAWSEFADRPLAPLSYPLRHPETIERDAAADAFLEETMYSGNLRRALGAIGRRFTRRGDAVPGRP
jgi:hypothetical protein